MCCAGSAVSASWADSVQVGSVRCLWSGQAVAIHKPGWQHSAPHNSRFLQSVPHPFSLHTYLCNPSQDLISFLRAHHVCMGLVNCPGKGQCRESTENENAVHAMPARDLQGTLKPVSCMRACVHA